MDHGTQSGHLARSHGFAHAPRKACVGHVGALAVALGVGFALALPAATASASPESETSSSTGSAGSVATGPTTATTTAPDDSADSTDDATRPPTGTSAPSPAYGRAPTTMATHILGPQSSSAKPRSITSRPSQRRSQGVPSRSEDNTAPAATDILIGTAQPAATVATEARVASSTTPRSLPATPPLSSIPASQEHIPTVTGSAAQESRAPSTMSAPPANLFGTFGGTSAPVSITASWVVAAAARREITSASTKLDSVTAPSAPTTAAITSLAASYSAAVTNRAPVIKKVTTQAPNSTTGAVTGKVTASDADKDPLTYGAPTLSAKGGTVNTDNTTGAFTYTPTKFLRHAASRLSATTADKTDTFTVTVYDGKGGATARVVTVPISPQNTSPILTVTASAADPRTGAVRVTMVATDPDGDLVGFFGANIYEGDVAWSGAITANGSATSASFVYTPTAATRHAAAGAAPLAKNVTLDVEVQDSYGGRTHGSVTVPIVPQNSSPVITAATVDGPNSKGVVKGKITATDSDRDTVTYIAGTTAQGKVSVNAKTGSFTYTPTSAARHAAATNVLADKTDTVTFTISDGYGGVTTTALTVNILPKNAAPTAKVSVGKANTTTGVITGKIVGTDADKDIVTYSALNTTAKGTLSLDPKTGTFTYTPTPAARIAAGAVGATRAAKTDTFTVTLSDGHGAVVTKTVNVTVAPPGPGVAPTIGSINVGQPDSISGVVGGSVSASDANGDSLSYSLGKGPTKGAVSVAANGSFTYTPTTAQRTTTTTLSDSFTVNVSDGLRVSVATVSVPVAPIPSQLVAGQRLTSGQYLLSTNGRYKLVMQGDGNLVLYDNQTNSARWSTGTNGRANVSATMQGDGNFVLYSGQTAVWNTATNGFGGARIVVQDDANIVVYHGGNALWDRHAGRLNPGGGGSTGGGLSAKVTAFVQAFQGKVWGQARYGTKAYTNPASLTNNPSSPYFTPDMVGECVSLVTQFLKYAFNITPGAWGDAYQWRAGATGGNQMAAHGFTWRTDKNLQNGDILVFSSNHIGIYYNGQLFDSNNTAGGRGANGVGGWAARHAGFGSINAVSGYVGYWRKN